MQEGTAARRRLEMHLVRLTQTLHLQGCLLADPLADRLRIVDEHIARHLVADAEEDKKPDNHNGQNGRQELRPYGFELHEHSSKDRYKGYFTNHSFMKERITSYAHKQVFSRQNK